MLTGQPVVKLMVLWFQTSLDLLLSGHLLMVVPMLHMGFQALGLGESWWGYKLYNSFLF